MVSRMVDVQVLRDFLTEEFGILSNAELEEALRGMKKINIGAMRGPTAGGDQNGESVQKSA